MGVVEVVVVVVVVGEECVPCAEELQIRAGNCTGISDAVGVQSAGKREVDSEWTAVV